MKTIVKCKTILNGKTIFVTKIKKRLYTPLCDLDLWPTEHRVGTLVGPACPGQSLH